MTNYRKVIIGKLLVLVLVLALAALIQISLTSPLENDGWTDIGGPARSPAGYVEHCDYIPLAIADHVPDGLFVNCR